MEKFLKQLQKLKTQMQLQRILNALFKREEKLKLLISY